MQRPRSRLDVAPPEEAPGAISSHVVVRGVDREGREVRLDRGYISNGLRWRAQELATEELGPRLEADIRRVRVREISQERFTSLDRELERRANDHRVQPRSGTGAGRIDESTLVGRLEYLEDLRLAERVESAAWTLTPGWQAELRELGARGDILKQIHKAIADDRVRHRIVREGQAIEPGGGKEEVFFGRIASKGLSDEAKGRFYAVLETPQGEAFHVPLDARAAEQLRKGDLVSFATRQEAAVRAVDREVAEVARAGEGSASRVQWMEERILTPDGFVSSSASAWSRACPRIAGRLPRTCRRS